MSGMCLSEHLSVKTLFRIRPIFRKVQSVKLLFLHSSTVLLSGRTVFTWPSTVLLRDRPRCHTKSQPRTGNTRNGRTTRKRSPEEKPHIGSPRSTWADGRGCCLLLARGAADEDTTVPYRAQAALFSQPSQEPPTARCCALSHCTADAPGKYGCRPAE